MSQTDFVVTTSQGLITLAQEKNMAVVDGFWGRCESGRMSCQAAIGQQVRERKDKTVRGREVRMISTLRSGQ